MMKKKQILAVCGLFVVIAVAASFAIVAARETPWGCGCPFRPHVCESGPHGAFPSEKMVERMLAHLDDRVEGLELTDFQEIEYQSIRSDIREKMLQGMEDHRLLRQELREELNRDDPDPAVLSRLMKERIRRVSGAMEEGLDRFVSFYEILYPEQQSLILEKMREKAQ